MAKLTPARRARLPKSDFACPINAPGAGSYPINDPSHVSSAKTYYQRKGTVKCRGGKTRICKRAKRFGLLKKPSWKSWCRGLA